MPRRSWPSALWLVRHGESVTNAATVRAWRDGDEVVAVEGRDADVELTALGVAQAEALGRWFTALPPGERPQCAHVSTYLRARRTAELALGGLGPLPTTVDERLRDRELGVLEGLTQRGIEARHPAEAAVRARLGKFYHRPSGGESWADVALRVRSALGDIRADHAGERVVVVAHDIVVLLFRYLIEGLDEAGVLHVSAHTAVRNGGVTAYDLRDGAMALRHYNAVVDPDGRLRPDAPGS